MVNYSYLSDGTKLSALDGSGEGLVYRGPFVYRKGAGNGNSSLTLESAAFGGGRLTPTGAMLYVTDYLGSVRAVVNGKTGELYKASDYSAFGEESDVVVPQYGVTPAHQLATAALPDGLTLRDGYTGKEAQNPDFNIGYTDFGARQYNPALRRWMTPDPLSEKYYGVSPYAFCANNPVNLVDLDGRVWVNKQKQIVCDANGPTVHATPEEVELIKAMNSIKTGRQQLQKLIDAPFDVQVIFGHDERLKHYGNAISFNVQYDANKEQYVAKGGSIITIFEEGANLRSAIEGISVNEAKAANLGHEIEHITNEGLSLSIKYKGDLSNEAEEIKEKKPVQISKMMVQEFINMPRLNDTKDMQHIIKSKIQSECGIIINF